ncbi:TetR/AcrR family transcriptional regulator [Paramagnetospirillum kuznetsovii]|uniref:TetR/AcrR family transcriptional regulator n=1 Tax=Paramagnetospirillum kuznetsovii TaxID=2053833 RepID=A0A364NTJ8_9PROT|nr:TetR/AcrR family transcriptional regulator [Paramagnetospirillum kuznetsovii]RAU20372.1 TetR/AcrR family transcriptional regulator [Paramagnetospirillum kuznetsovii]
MSTSDTIIDAAMAIVRDQGVGKLTLDAAAKVAGVSKGGVLYHFKSKDDLIRGMVQRLIDQCDQLNRDYYQREPEGPYRWARTLVRACFDPTGPANDPVGGALLAAITVNPDLMAPVHAMYALWQDRIASDSPDVTRAGLIRTAMDGLYFQRLMGIRLGDDKAGECLMRHALDLLTVKEGGPS